jgi:hypothetical protein
MTKSLHPRMQNTVNKNRPTLHELHWQLLFDIPITQSILLHVYFFTIHLTLYILRGFKTSGDAFRLPYSIALKLNTDIQRMHKRMVQFQKLTRNLFLTLHGHNVQVSSGNCPKFLMRYQQFALMLTAGPRGQFPRWRRSRKRLSVCSILKCPDLWLQCSVSFVHSLEMLVAHATVQVSHAKISGWWTVFENVRL